MAGIFGFFSKSIDGDHQYHRYMFSSYFDHIVNRQFMFGESGIIGRSSLNKYEDDRFEHQENDFFFLNEGTLLNYDRKDLPGIFIRDYFKNEMLFFHRLKGSYCGAIVSRNGENICLYNDFMGTRPVYYYHNPQKKIFLFSSELKFISSVLKKEKVDIEPEELAWKELSINGYLIGDHTLIKNVKKLPRNSLLYWNRTENYVEVKSQGFDIDEAERLENTKEVFDAIESRLRWNIRASREKDRSYGYEHFQALSGGLDSRVNTGLGQHLGYVDAKALTFTQSGTSEEACARAFARNAGINHIVSYLDDGHFIMTDLMATGLANDGMIKIHGGAHQYHNIKNNIKDHYGMFHSGQIGDAVFGSFTRWGRPVYEMVRKQAFFRDDSTFDHYFKDDARINKYDQYGEKGYMRYTLEERVVNSAFNGDQICYHFCDAYSPFCDRELISILYNQPANHLRNQKIYFDFLKERFPFLLKVRLDRSFFAPYHYRLYYWGNFLFRIWKKLNKREHMNPHQVWFDENPAMRKWLYKEYKRLHLLYGDEKFLQSLLRFDEKTITGHMQPLTLLLAYDTLFGEQLVFMEQINTK